MEFTPMKGMPATRVAALLLASTGVLGVLVIAGGTILPSRNQPAVPLADAPRAPGKSTEDRTIAEATSTVEALTGSLGAARVKPTDSSGPVFDVARIGPAGEAVIAGRAAPGASVELLRAGTVHDKTVADQSGEFVFVPNPLPPGDYSLTLRATQSDGTVLTSKNSVAVALRSGKPDVVLALLEKPPGALPGGKPDASRSADIAIVAVESKESGKLYVSGRSEPGATVKLYLNGSYIASATASAEGRVAFAIGSGITPGNYRVRLDVVDGAAGLRSRAEGSFSAPALNASASATAAAPSAPDAPGSASVAGLAEAKPTLDGGGSVGRQLSASAASASGPAPEVSAATIEPEGVAVVPRIGTAVVNRGDNLWHISRSTYGQGVRYSKIYDANRHQIRNPAVIFPGQIFVLPKAPSGE
jgi:nucleoid-associated protein YgaU